jgi:hypothetical protein
MGVSSGRIHGPAGPAGPCLHRVAVIPQNLARPPGADRGSLCRGQVERKAGAIGKNGPGMCEPAGGARRGSRPGGTVLSARAVRPREGRPTTCARPARSIMRD